MKNLLSTAADQISEGADAITSLVEGTMEKVRPAPKPSRLPWVLLAVLIAAAAGAGWWFRSQETDEPFDDDQFSAA